MHSFTLKFNRETQDKISESLRPTSYDKSVSDILGFIRDIDENTIERDEKGEEEEEEEEEYVLCDLDEFDTQREWIQATPSKNRSYNYLVSFSAVLSSCE